MHFDGGTSSRWRPAARRAGFTAEVHDNGPTRVEVRFSNGQTEWRIRVDVVNGALVSPRSRSTERPAKPRTAGPGVFLPTIPQEEPMDTPNRPSRAHRPSPAAPARRVLAIGAGVAMVPALYAVASAATGGGSDQPGDGRPAAARRRRPRHRDRGRARRRGREAPRRRDHAERARGDVTPTPTTPQATTPTTPEVTTPTTPEQEIEHPVPEPGDDNGNARQRRRRGHAGTDRARPGVLVRRRLDHRDGGERLALSLASSSPAAGFGAEVHDNGPEPGRGAVLHEGQTEWRIRIELGSGGLTSEITQHG